MAHIKHIIWDLGDTLVYPKTWCFAREIGLFDFISYPVIDGRNPFKLYKLAFQLLESIEPLTNSEKQGIQPTTRGEVLPVLIRRWLTGHLDHPSLMQNINDEIQRWHAQKLFISEREMRLLKNTLHVMFNPPLLAACLRPINEAVLLVERAANSYNHEGELLFTQYILSNWDASSFHDVLEQDLLQPVFKYFNRDNIFISGTVGTMKPDPTFYQAFFEKYQVLPDECLLIDDLEENVLTARELGMTTIHLQKQNYTQVRTFLNHSKSKRKKNKEIFS